MPKLATLLTDIQLKNAKAKEKDYRLTDGVGLCLLITTDGAKYWRMDYCLHERCNTLAFGKHPEVSLVKTRFKKTTRK